MGAGDDTTTTAAARLRLLKSEFTARRAAAGDSSPPGRTRPAHAPVPVDLDVLDHLAASLREIVDHTHTVAPAAGPPPADLAAAYQWMVNQTPHLDDERRRVQDALVYRQSLEHALAMGDRKVVRQISCPACHCYGLVWVPELGRARCVNRRCFTGGRPSLWTLAQLAAYEVEKGEGGQRTAT